MAKQKNAIQNFKIEEDAKEQFNKLCDDNHTTASQALRKYVHQSIEKQSL
jgi:antitoxin component of RelBE/YafQ-DinJ toxin-antitoxin module